MTDQVVNEMLMPVVVGLVRIAGRVIGTQFSRKSLCSTLSATTTCRSILSLFRGGTLWLGNLC